MGAPSRDGNSISPLSRAVVACLLVLGTMVAGVLVAWGAPAGAATPGSISGTVTAAVGGAPLSGICVLAVVAGIPGPPVTQVATGSDGTYTLSGLDPTHTYDVSFYIGGCPGGTPGNYIGQWWDNVSSQAAATPVSVTSGVITTGINAAMVAGGVISGTVTAASGGAPLANICVITAVVGIPSPQPGWLGGTAATGSDGTYTIMGLNPALTYDVNFDSLAFGPCGAGGVTSNYVDQWWDNVSSQSSATAVSVTSGGTTAGINAAMATGGQISGTVTAASTRADLSGICVIAYLAGGNGTPVRYAAGTGSNGLYTLSGLDPAHTYDVSFDSTGSCPGGTNANYVIQWWDNVFSQADATAVSVTSGGTQTGISAAMVVTPIPPPPPSGSTSSASGTSSSSTGTATATNDNTTASATGGGAVTVSQYSSNPVNSPSFSSAGGYFDVALSSDNAFTSVTIDNCNLNGGTSLQWWNTQGNGGSGAWQPVVPTPTYTAGPPACLSVTLNSSTSPSLSQLTGTVFAVTSSLGYWLVASDGGVFSYGDAAFYGSTGGMTLNKPIVGMASTPDGHGYWLVASDGGVFSYGDATFHGSAGALTLNKPIVGMASTPDGHGYWLVASDGGVFSYGDAAFYGSTGGMTLNKPIVGMASTPDGHGYWLVASDGGVFAYGDAAFYGSTGGMTLNKPIVGMAATASGHGYWLVASDGGVFSYGDATFHGSAGALTLNKPIVGMAATASGHGYWLVASDGGVFSYGDATFHGSAGALTLNKPIVGMAATASGHGYWLVASDGGVFSYGDATF